MRLTTKEIAKLLVPFVFIPLVGQTPSTAPSSAKSNAQQIQVELEKCLNGANANDMRMLDCYESAYERMDRRLNEVYRELISHLSPRQKEALQDAQRKWLHFREAEEKFTSSLSLEDGAEAGTLDRVQGMAQSYDLLKRRTEELEGRLKSLSHH